MTRFRWWVFTAGIEISGDYDSIWNQPMTLTEANTYAKLHAAEIAGTLAFPFNPFNMTILIKLSST